MNFAGLQNYLKAFGDASFVSAFWQTAKVAVVSIILINLFAFAVAMPHREHPGRNLFRSVFSCPTSSAASCWATSGIPSLPGCCVATTPPWP